MLRSLLFVPLLALATASPVQAAEPPVTPVVHEEFNRALDDLVGGLGDRWRDYFGRRESAADRPLITLMLGWRQELGLSQAQVQSLEKLRSDFQREATRRDADLHAAETALGALVQADPVDLVAVEAKLRDVERQRADLRMARIKTVEQGKEQLTLEQRTKLSALLAGSAPRRSGTPTTFDVTPR